MTLECKNSKTKRLCKGIISQREGQEQWLSKAPGIAWEEVCKDCPRMQLRLEAKGDKDRG